MTGDWSLSQYLRLCWLQNFLFDLAVLVSHLFSKLFGREIILKSSQGQPDIGILFNTEKIRVIKP